MRIAMAQVSSPEDEPVTERLSRVASMIAEARGADLVILPELWRVGYFSFGAYPTEAEDLTGPTVKACAGWAKDLGCHVHCGSLVERGRDGRLYNTSVLLDPAGDVVASYRKIHVFGHRSREAELISAGDEVVSGAGPDGGLGLATCYDLRFPELWRMLVDQGARVVLTPAAWPLARLEHWRLFTSARAVEEQIFTVSCNATGTSGGIELAGHSRVVSPDGTLLWEAGREEGLAVVDLDPALVEDTRRSFPALRDRRLWPSPIHP